MLQGNFRQGVIEPILDASWAPAASTFYYEAQLSYDGGQSWSNAYQGDQPSFSKVVDYASLLLRVRGVGVKMGAFNQIAVEPPTISLRPDVIALESFKAGLRDYVETQLKQGFDTLNKIAQFVASVTSEQEAHNWLQRNETHSLLEVKAGQASAAIEEVWQVAVDVGTALATMQTDVVAKIGGPNGTGTIQTSVSTNATAIATVNGKLAASWSVTLNANGYISGIRSYNDGSTAGTIFVGDIFQIAFPGQNGGAPVPVFGIGSGPGLDHRAGDASVHEHIAAQHDLGSTIDAIDAVHLKANSITAGKIAAGAINVGNLIADNVIVTGHLQVNSVAVVSVSSPADQIGVLDNTSAPRLIATLTVFVVPGGGNLLIQGGFNINSIPGGVGSGSFPATSQADYRFLMSYIQINFDFGLQRQLLIPPTAAYNNFMTIMGSPQITLGLQGVAPGFHQIDLYWIPSPFGQSDLNLNFQAGTLTCMEARR